MRVCDCDSLSSLSGFASFQSFSATPSVRAGSVMKVHAPQVA